MSFRRFVSGTVLLAIFTASAGCAPSGPPLGQVAGTVTLGDQPLDNAFVLFSPKTDKAEAGSSYAITDKSGRYALSFGSSRKGAYLGAHTVTIEHASHTDRDLSATVAEGKNTIDFPLQRKKGSKPVRQREHEVDRAVPLEATVE